MQLVLVPILVQIPPGWWRYQLADEAMQAMQAKLEPMLILAGEITQVKEAIPWVRCASGNV